MSEEELYEHYNNIMKDNAKRVDPEVPSIFYNIFSLINLIEIFQLLIKHRMKSKIYKMIFTMKKNQFHGKKH
jgi:hypothetical protein